MAGTYGEEAPQPLWETCYTSAVEAQAHVVKGYLETFGVPCVVEPSPFGMLPAALAMRAETKVLVPEDWAHIARGLIRGRELDAYPKLRVLNGGKA